MRSNADRRAARNPNNVAQPAKSPCDPDADRKDRAIFERAFGLPRHAACRKTVQAGHTVYLLRGVTLRASKRGEVFSAPKGRRVTVLSREDTLHGFIFYGAFRATRQTGGVNDHVLVQRAIAAEYVSVYPVRRGKRGGGKGSGNCPGRRNTDGFMTLGKEAEIG